MSACLSLVRTDAVSCTDERGQAGRIEHYIHSDAITPNKGGALVKVLCDTDFAARTPEFIRFVRLVAKFAYAASAVTWADITTIYPVMEDELTKVQKTLDEHISIASIVCMTIN